MLMPVSLFAAEGVANLAFFQPYFYAAKNTISAEGGITPYVAFKEMSWDICSRDDSFWDNVLLAQLNRNATA